MATIYVPVTGMIQQVRPVTNECTQHLISIRNSDGITNFIVDSDTYVIGTFRLRPGMTITAFYDGAAPMPLIYPPQYRAVFIGRNNSRGNMYAGIFDDDLLSEDGTLKLTPDQNTEIVTSNGQRYTCGLGAHVLIVYYTTSTRSIPAITTPRKIIVIL